MLALLAAGGLAAGCSALPHVKLVNRTDEAVKVRLSADQAGTATEDVFVSASPGGAVVFRATRLRGDRMRLTRGRCVYGYELPYRALQDMQADGRGYQIVVELTPDATVDLAPTQKPLLPRPDWRPPPPPSHYGFPRGPVSTQCG